MSLTDAGRTVSAEVLLMPTVHHDFRTDDRYADLPGDLVPGRCSTPVKRWDSISGRPRFTRRARWQLPNGLFRYGELALTELAIIVAPGP